MTNGTTCPTCQASLAPAETCTFCERVDAAMNDEPIPNDD